MDDDPLIREASRICLEVEGYEVHAAENGKAAVDVLDYGLRPVSNTPAERPFRPVAKLGNWFIRRAAWSATRLDPGGSRGGEARRTRCK